MTHLDEEKGESGKQPKTGLVWAILGGSLIIALGLAFGLGLGLRHLNQGAVLVAETVTTPAPPAEEPLKSRTGTYRFASVSANNQQCSEIGTDILARCGSAVDAAIATAVCNSILDPSAAGIGGGFFMTIYNRASGAVDVLDARERAPLAANSTMFVGRLADASLTGGLAIAVPGEVKGYWEAHQRYGKLPWNDLFQPTIKLCRDGVPINYITKFAIDMSSELLRKYNISMYFDPETGEPLNEGDTVTYRRLADTLETIANEGASAFYNGSLTATILQEIQENGGIITEEDLTGYTATWRTPVNYTMRDGHTIYSMPPPGSGVVIGYMLNILDGYNLTKDSITTDEKSILTYHRIVEAMKFAYAKRTHLGDEDFEDIADLVINMTSREFGDATREKLNDTWTQNTDYYEPAFSTRPDGGTSHVSVLDAQGNAVAITSTMNYLFGSKVLGRSTGIFYNDEMDDFSTPGVINAYGLYPSPTNFIKPRKRPLSSMCPSVFVDESGDVVLVDGAAGGSRITTSSMLVALHILNFGRTAGEALDYKRLHHQLLPTTLMVEDGFPKTVVEGLIAKGHVTTEYTIHARVNIVNVKDGMLHAAADVRARGVPDGY